MATHSVFYSWQSDLPNSINRGFIQECLQRAIKEVRADKELSLEPCLERDTDGVTGAPDIAATIFEKIMRADVFVGDVTFVDVSGLRSGMRDRIAATVKSVCDYLLGRRRLPSRRSPNPNVLVELGFAAACLKWEKVICIFNASYGRIEDLPFDIRSRVVRSYTLSVGQDKAETRRRLVASLKDDIAALCGSRWANVGIVGSYFRNVQGALGIGFTVTNTGTTDLPPYDIAIVHPKGGTYRIFPSEKSGPLLRDQKREHRCTIIRDGKIDPFFSQPSMTQLDDAGYKFRLVLEASEKVLYENGRVARGFVKVFRLMLASAGTSVGMGTDWLELNNSLPDE